jgi:hypothetical protein
VGAGFPSGQINPGSSWTYVMGGGTDNLSVTAINVDVWAVAPGANDAIQFGLSLDNCSSTFYVVESVNPGGIGPISVPIGDGWHIGAYQLCARNNDTANLDAAVFALAHDLG